MGIKIEEAHDVKEEAEINIIKIAFVKKT